MKKIENIRDLSIQYHLKDCNIIKIINKNALYNNIKVFKKLCGKSKICAVVKANAYGLGDELIVNLIKNRVDFFAVANFDEAFRVRKWTNKPILILGEIDYNNIEDCINNNISLSVSNEKSLKQINKVAVRINKVAKIHFKINTGMNRLGFKNLNTFLYVYNKYKNKENIIYEGIFSHIYDADNYEKTKKQKHIFDTFLNSIDNQNLIKHIASTSVCLKYSNMNYDMCRIGIGLYNYAPNNKYFLQPILSLKTKIINIIKINKNENVGYGCGFVANKKMKIAVLPIGYADGLSRLLSNKSKVLLKNNFCNIIGNVCMDMCFIDVTNVACKIGDIVTIIGKENDKEINAVDIAKIVGSIDYEVITNINNARSKNLVI